MIDRIVIGGPSHGSRFEHHHYRVGEFRRVPIDQGVRLEDLPPDIGWLEYRLCECQLRRGLSLRYWVPANVPEAEELMHVFKIAVGGSVF